MDVDGIPLWKHTLMAVVMIAAAFIAMSALCGCATYRPQVVPIPEDDPSTHFRFYQHTRGFSGTRVTIGTPALGWIPIIGPYMGDLVKLEWGGVQDVFTPVMEVSEYEKQARAMAAARRAAAGRNCMPDHQPQQRLGAGQRPVCSPYRR